MARIADLYLVGTGISTADQMTIEARRVLARCRIVFHLTLQHAELSAINPNTMDLSKLYWTGEEVTVVYDRLFRTIMDEVRRGPGVASVAEGHPLFYDDCHMRLTRHCKRLKRRCVVLPAVSCLDTISVDLGADYSAPGLQVFEATSVVENEFVLNPNLHTLLLQVGEFGTDVTPDRVETKKNMFKPLEKYLRRFYPPGHRAVICFSQNRLSRKIHFSTRIDRLDYHRRQVFPGTTLYLPPAT